MKNQYPHDIEVDGIVLSLCSDGSMWSARLSGQDEVSYGFTPMVALLEWYGLDISRVVDDRRVMLWSSRND